MRVIKATLCLFCVLTASIALGAEYKVCPNGSGAGATDGSDWANCMDGFDDIGTPSAGEVFWLRDDGGSYKETLTIPSSGSSGSPIAFQAESGEKPIIDGSEIVTGWTGGPVYQVAYDIGERGPTLVFIDSIAGTYAASVEDLDTNNEWFHDGASDILYVYSDTAISGKLVEAATRYYGIDCSSKNYITIKNVTVQKANGFGILVEDSDNIILESTRAIDTSSSGIMIQNGSNTVSVSYGEVSRNGKSSNGLAVDDCNGIGINGATAMPVNITIDGVTLAGNKADAISIYSNGSGDLSPTISVKNCIIKDTTDGAGIRADGMGTWISITNNEIYRNIGGIIHYDGLVGSGAAIFGIANNTIRANTNDGIHMEGAEAEASINSNIIDGNGDSSNYFNIMIPTTIAALSSDYNLFNDTGNFLYYDSAARDLAGWQTATSQDANSVSGDPLFSDAGNDFYSPLIHSPVCGAGEGSSDIGAKACLGRAALIGF